MTMGWWIFWGLVAMAAVVAGVWFWRRRRYLDHVSALGWSNDSDPSTDAVADLHVPPFGLGMTRKVDELVSGATGSGRAFRAFDYDYTMAGPGFGERVVALQLPFALPEVYLRPAGQPDRTGIGSGDAELFQVTDEHYRVVSSDAALAEAVRASCVDALAELAQAEAGQVDLSVDGNQLVALGAPKSPEQLSALLTALEPVAAALGSTAVRGFEVPAAGTGLGFYGHPDWSYTAGNDAVLSSYPITADGFDHQAVDVLTGNRDGIAMAGFEHRWRTTEMVPVTDGRGNVSLRPRTVDHSEVVLGFTLPAALPSLSVNGRHLGERCRFESDAFNDAFDIRAENPKYASDVIHPRMMEWLLARRPIGWTMVGTTVLFEVDRHDTLVAAHCGATLRGFLGRIPRFVWTDVGVDPPPFLVE